MVGSEIVSVPWRGCLASCVKVIMQRSLKIRFRPLAGMCCVCMLYHVPNEAKRFPSPGGDVLRPVIVEKYPEYKELFPSPGGDVLRQDAALENVRAEREKMFPSPDGDVLRPSRAGHGRTGNCFRPLAGMCCVSEYEEVLKQFFQFPSPGGDVLRLTAVQITPRWWTVSVPWRGCVASGEAHRDGDAEEVSVPWRGCVASNVGYLTNGESYVSVPWRGCVASANLHKTIFQKGIFSCFPLPFCNIL